MGIRSRLKGRLKRLAGDQPQAVTPESPTPIPPSKSELKPAPASPEPPPAVATEVPPPTPEATPAAPKPVDEEKVKRHRAKAQRGVLKHLANKGGTMAMKDLHDFSEQRYFIAHAGFSKMMEFFVDNHYVDFDQDTYTVNLSEGGREFISTP